MTEVIRKGKPWRRRTTCRACDSLLDYGKNDLQTGVVSDTFYLLCPICQHRIFMNAMGK